LGPPKQEVDLRIESRAQKREWAEPFLAQLEALLKRVLQHTVVEAKMVKVKRKTRGDIDNRPLQERTAQDCSKDVPGARVEVSIAAAGAKKSFQPRLSISHFS
jgi:hypothetical protein